jgi:putative ABC transport system permease protein
VGLYNTLHGRRREIAVLRALGARPRDVFAVILLEALLLCLLGGLLGLLLGHGAIVVLAPRALAEYGVRVEADPGLLDLQRLGGLLALGAVAGFLPAWRGLRTPVAQNLSPVEG